MAKIYLFSGQEWDIKTKLCSNIIEMAWNINIRSWEQLWFFLCLHNFCCFKCTVPEILNCYRLVSNNCWKEQQIFYFWKSWLHPGSQLTSLLCPLHNFFFFFLYICHQVTIDFLGCFVFRWNWLFLGNPCDYTTCWTWREIYVY